MQLWDIQLKAHRCWALHVEKGLEGIVLQAHTYINYLIYHCGALMGTKGSNQEMLFPCGLQVKQVSSTLPDVRSLAASVKKEIYFKFAMRVPRMANHCMSCLDEYSL